MSTPSIAAGAYAAVGKIASPGPAAPASAGGSGAAPQSFTTMLRNALGSVAEAGQASDAQMRAVAAGKANMVDVVTAVSETEVAVDALVAVRDRVIQSYEDIMKMPI